MEVLHSNAGDWTRASQTSSDIQHGAVNDNGDLRSSVYDADRPTPFASGRTFNDESAAGSNHIGLSAHQAPGTLLR